MAIADITPGVYSVTASVPESNVVTFTLTNAAFTPANIQAAIDAAGPGGITLQPTSITPLNVILATIAGLGPQPSTAKVTVSLPKTMSPYPSVLALLPVGLNFTLNGNGSSVSGNVTIIQLGGSNTTVENVNMIGDMQILVGYGDPTLDDVNVGGSLLVLIGNGDPVVNNLNVGGDLDVLVGNANNGSVVVAQSKVAGNVQIQAGNGDADSLTIGGLSVGGDAQIQAGNGNADQISVSGLTVSRNGNARIETGNGKADAITADGWSWAGTSRSRPATAPAIRSRSPRSAARRTSPETPRSNWATGPAIPRPSTAPAARRSTVHSPFRWATGATRSTSGRPGDVTFGGAVQVQFGNGTNTLNLAGTKGGAVPGSQVYFKKQAVFDGRNGKNTRYVGVNVFGGAAVQQLLTVRSAPSAINLATTRASAPVAVAWRSPSVRAERPTRDRARHRPSSEEIKT